MKSRNRRQMYHLLSVVLAVGFIVTAIIVISNRVWAVTTTTTIRPSSTVTGAWSTTGGAGGGTCTGHCDFVDEVAAPNGDGNSSYVQTATVQTEEYGMQDVTGGQRATAIKVRVYNTRQTTGTGGGQLQVNLRINGTLQTVVTQSWTGPNGTYKWFETDFTNAGWTQSDINSAQVWLSKTVGTLGSTYRVSTVEAVVTWASPALNQFASRTYLNQNNIQPGAPLAATNTAAEVAQNTAFRVRAGIQVADVNWLTGSWGAHSNQYKLQYAQKSAGTCSAQASGWADVGAATPIRWQDNASVADGAAITSNANDPDTGASTKIYQSYEEANSFGLTLQTNVGQTAIWDFSLTNSGVTPGTRYCLRIVQNDGTTLTSYTAASFPEVLITGSLGLSIVDSGGVDVASPVVTFPNQAISTTSCQTATATLGTASQKLRIVNDLVTNGWNVSIAATSGPTTTWTSGANGYDYNDPAGAPAGCGDGGDSDARAGRLTIDPSGATITPSSGCGNTGVSSGTSAGYNEGTTDTITLTAANSSSSRFCYWDVTGINLSQTIPKTTPAGSYTMNMTVTVTAL